MPPSPTQLIPQLQTLHDQVIEIRRQAEESATGLTDAQLSWSPDRKTWSAGQILEHLNKVGQALLPGLNPAIQELQDNNLRSNGPFRYGRIERWFIRMLSPNPPFKVPVPPQYVPPSAEAVKDAVACFLKLQEDLLAAIQAANGLNLTARKVVSPASKMVRLSVGAWLEATVAHEQYHLLQLQELLKRPDFPAS